MIQRWKVSPNQSMVTEPDGEWVEYKDHISAMEERDRGIIVSIAAVLSALFPNNVEVRGKEDSDDSAMEDTR